MAIEEIIREWKEGKQEKSNQHLLKNPVGEELSDVELAEAIGGQPERAAYTKEVACYYSNDASCYRSLGITC